MWTSSASACSLAEAGDLPSLQRLPPDVLHEPDKHGNYAIHWAAGSGQTAVVQWLIESAGMVADSEGRVSTRSKRRRPLHYAARNGHIEMVRFLCERLGATPDARDRQSVSPLQLAVWQNHLEVARYLVEEHGVDVKQVNTFDCGLQHWLGTCPPERAGADGELLLPMAVWLRSFGLDWFATQRQGHRPLHKAGWGGHLALCRWLRDECGALDDLQDLSGNWAADVAEMAGHTTLAAWLRSDCSDARRRSCALLGLPHDTTDPSLIRAAYLDAARRLHPDSAHLRRRVAEEEPARSHISFEAVRSAFHHLSTEGGRGSQSNPTHSIHKMLAVVSVAPESGLVDVDGMRRAGDGSGGGERELRERERGQAEEVACFKARLAATVHEYGEEGLPIGSLRRKFAQVRACA